MLLFFIRVLSTLFPFIKEMILSVDKGNYAKISLILTILLIMTLLANIAETRVVFALLKQNKENQVELKAQKKLLDEATAALKTNECASVNDVVKMYSSLLVQVNKDLAVCTAKLPKSN